MGSRILTIVTTILWLDDMPKKKIAYIISNVHKSLAFEWTAKGLRDNYRLTFILLNPSSSPLEEFLRQQKIEVIHIPYRSKRDFLKAFFKVFFYLLLKKPTIVHAHLLDAQLIGLTAAWMAGISSRIYTRHTSNYHHVYHRKGIRLDVWSNRLATRIVSISQATDNTLLQLEGVSPVKVVKIYHGFELSAFTNVSRERTVHVRKKWNIQDGTPIIGVIARHIEWKGIQYLIPAFQRFLKINTNACLVLANATGPYHNNIVELLKTIPANRVIIIPFEEDVAALYTIFDLFVHVPVDPICEAFGQIYVESLAAGVPSIFTRSGVAAEFIEHGKNAIVVEFRSVESIYWALEQLWKNAELRGKLRETGKRDVFLRFDLATMLTSLRNLYDE